METIVPGVVVVVTKPPSRDCAAPTVARERADAAAPPLDVAAQIESELIRYVVRQAPIGFAIGILAVVGIATVLWNATPSGLLWIWLLMIGSLTLPAGFVVWRCARAPDVADATRWWQSALTVAYGLAGAGWGMAAIVLYPRIAPHYQMFLLVVLGGAGVSGIAALAPVRSAFVAYLTATFVPLVVVLLRAGSLATMATGFLLIAFWISTISLASALRALLVRSLRLHFENLAHLVTLTRTRDVLQGALSSTTRDVAVLADELAAANRSKDEFLAIVSHELRTPLTPILTWAALLQRRHFDPTVVDRGLQTIARNAKLQARIVGDLLDVSRAITGKLQLDVCTLALEPVISAAIDALRPAADAKGVRLEAALDADVRCISGDPERLQQVVWNLVSNAVKFTPRGGRVDVGLRNVGDHVRLTVRDDGVGIAPASLPRLFERFWQSDTSFTRAQSGLGLGLAIVRHLVELHGGTVDAASEGEGHGAIFTVTFPALSAVSALSNGSSAIEDRGPLYAARLRGVKILVVDDDCDTSETIGAVLDAEGAEVRTCLSASEALQLLDAWVPDIMVSDIAMPGEDGYTLMRKIRARKAAAGGRMLAVALTAYGGNEDRLRALSAGFQIHVGKPIEPQQLVRIVANVVERRDVIPH
jgi:signal transduction histidine kinase/ActR/RegA family two-component response regulator